MNWPAVNIDKKGQVLSSDLALSILIFSVASIIAYTLVGNMMQDVDYQAVQLQAKELSGILVTNGYPQHWYVTVNTTTPAFNTTNAQQMGIVSADQLSIRKTRLLPMVSTQTLKSKLRIKDHFSIYFTPSNNSHSALGIMGICALSDINSNNTNISSNKTLPAIIISQPGNALNNRLNTTATSYPSFMQANEFMGAQDVIILEGALLNVSSFDVASLSFFQQSKRGITYVIIGDVRDASITSQSNTSNILGIKLNMTTVSSINVVGTNGAALGLLANEPLTIVGTLPLLEDLTNSTDSAVSGYTVIAKDSSGKAVYASWLYNDAQVYYFATTSGTNSVGTILADIIANATKSMVVVSWPNCTVPIVPNDAKQTVSYKRTLPYHDQLLDVHMIVWRNK